MKPAMPATFGGPNWVSRTGTMSEDLGVYWSKMGVTSEVDPLRAVMLVEPPESLAAVTDPDAALLLDRIDLGKIRAEYEELATAYETAGVEVHRIRPAPSASPNCIFARDLFWPTPEGAVVARMASPVRAGEEKLITGALISLGMPIRMTVGGRGLFEGADALWVDEKNVLYGIGRSNAEPIGQLQALWQDIRFWAVPVPSGVQHLLGAVNFLDDRIVALHPDAGETLRKTLAQLGVEIWEMAEGEELRRGRALNFVALDRKKILMPARCPQTRRSWEARGVEVREVFVDEYLKAAGGPGCLTGILRRG